jgi:ketosteroid isomerase-like protein
MKKNIKTLALSFILAASCTQVAFSQSSKSAGKVFKEGADKDKVYTLGSDKSMNVVLESMKAYNTNDAAKDLSFYSDEVVKKNAAYMNEWHASMKTLNQIPYAMVPVRLKGSDEDLVFSWSQENREWKNGSKQKLNLLEIYSVNKEGKITNFSQFQNVPKSNEFGLAEGGKIFLKDSSTTFTFTNRGEVETVEKMVAAFNKMDALAVAKLHTDSIIFNHSNGYVEKVASKTFFASYFDKMKSVSWKIEGILPYKMTDTDPESGILVSGVMKEVYKDGTVVERKQMIGLSYNLDGKISAADNFAKALKFNANKMDDIKAEIVALEKKWDALSNSSDINGIAALYADDAVRYPNNQAPVIGKEAIKKSMLQERALSKGIISTSETIDVFGDENLVTEMGIVRAKDAKGKVLVTSRYTTVWKKINGKFQIIREMWNDTVATK